MSVFLYSDRNEAFDQSPVRARVFAQAKKQQHDNERKAPGTVLRYNQRLL